MVVLTSFMHPDSPIRLEQSNTRVVLDKKDLGVGTLYVAERSLSWKDNDIGFTLMYPNISLHAISNDPTVYSTECIYVMIDAHVRVPGVSYDEPIIALDSDEEESVADISELILVPDDSGAISTVYEALKACQALNPDPEDADEDEEIYEDADEEMQGITDDIGAGGDNAMDDLVNQLRNNSVEINYTHSNGDRNVNDDIFEDAD